MSSPWPDLVVGVDFGTTGTAVAYAMPKDDKVHQFTKWNEGPGDHSKVPTMVVFEGYDVKAWGFGVKNLDIDSNTSPYFHKLFKPLFNSEDRAEALEAERCMRAFLKELCANLEEELLNEKPLKSLKQNASTIKIKYVFSYPTTWSPSEQSRFSKLIQEAGFEAMDDQETMAPLDEAQAALMHFLYSGEGVQEKPPHREGENILVADVGGGTSDVSIFEVLSINGRKLKLESKVTNEGEDIGATHIDNQFKNKLRIVVKTKFQGQQERHSSGASQLSDDIIEKLSDTAIFHIEQSNSYIIPKHTYGQRAGRVQKPDFPLRIPNLAASNAGPHDIVDLKININKEEYFEDAFRDQCDKIWKQCKAQMEDPRMGSKTIHHVVLTGGLGSSPYTMTELSRHFKDHGQSKDATVIQVDDAQLAVSKGLVHNELFSILGGYGWTYAAQASYGIQWKQDDDSISWFIKRGDKLKVPCTKEITRHVNIANGTVQGSLKLVKAKERPIQSMGITNKAKKKDWNQQVQVIKDITDWVKESLPDDLEPGLSSTFRKTKKTPVTFKIKLFRDALTLMLEHKHEEHGRSFVQFESWHNPPRNKNKAKPEAEAKSKGSRWGSWGWSENLATVFGIATVAALGVAVMAYFQDKEGNEKDKKEKKNNNPTQTPNSDDKQGETGDGSLAPKEPDSDETEARNGYDTVLIIEETRQRPCNNHVATSQAHPRESQWGDETANSTQVVLSSRVARSEV